MRSKFEKLPEIRERLELSKTFGSLVFDGVLNMYLSGSICHILIEQVNFCQWCMVCIPRTTKET